LVKGCCGSSKQIFPGSGLTGKKAYGLDFIKSNSCSLPKNLAICVRCNNLAYRKTLTRFVVRVFDGTVSLLS